MKGMTPNHNQNPLNKMFNYQPFAPHAFCNLFSSRIEKRQQLCLALFRFNWSKSSDTGLAIKFRSLMVESLNKIFSNYQNKTIQSTVVLNIFVALFC